MSLVHFLHHDPTLPSDGEQSDQEDKEDYSDVVALYTKIFGEKPGRGWRGNADTATADGDSTTCGSCGANTDNSTSTNSTASTSIGTKKPTRKDRTAAATCSNCGSTCGGSTKVQFKKKKNARTDITATCGSACGSKPQNTWIPDLSSFFPARDDTLSTMSSLLTSLENNAASLERHLRLRAARDDVSRVLDNIFDGFFGGAEAAPPDTISPFDPFDISNNGGLVIIETNNIPVQQPAKETVDRKTPVAPLAPQQTQEPIRVLLA